MKIAIVSDSHDNVPNIEKFLNWISANSVKLIIHCGDLAAPSMLSKLFAKKFTGPIHLIYGNVADREALEKMSNELKNVTLHGDQGKITIDGQKIAFCHRPDESKVLAESGKYNIVFYGHSHQPWIEKMNNTELVNPGTLGGLFQKATFAIYDTKTKNIELKVLDKI